MVSGTRSRQVKTKAEKKFVAPPKKKKKVAPKKAPPPKEYEVRFITIHQYRYLLFKTLHDFFTITTINVTC